MDSQIITRDLRYQYDEKEHVRLAEDLAHQILARDQAVRLFEVAKAAHKAAVENFESCIRDLSRKLSDGWEIRDVPCRLLPNEPAPGQRTIIRVDTGEVIAVENMQSGAAIEPAADKLFETIAEELVDQINAGALDGPGVKVTAEVREAQ